MTSYHDFNSLQIAFEHVWSEVFDDRLHQVGRELYETYIGLLAATGRPPDAITVSSVDDIKTLMLHIGDLGRVVDSSGNTVSQGNTLQSGTAGPVQRVAGTFGAVREALVAELPNGWAAVVDDKLQPLKTGIDSAKNASQSGIQQQVQQLATTFVSARTAMTAAVGGNWSDVVDKAMVPLSLQIQWAKAAVVRRRRRPLR